MTQVDASSFTRVAVVAPRSRVDVALPSDVPVVDLLPGLLDMVGERSDDGGGSHDGWRLTDLDGRQLDPSRSLRALDVLDGRTLRMAPTRPPLAPPVHDDVVEAIADAVRARTDARSVREAGRAFAVGLLLVVTALVLVVGGTGLVGALVAAGVAVVALVVGRALAVGRAPLVGLTLAVASAAPAMAAGWLAVPAGSLLTHLLLGSAAALAVTIVGRLVVPGALTVQSALSTILGFTVLAALGGVLLGAPPAQALTAVSALAIAAMSFLPWLGVRMARLPMPQLPTSAESLRDPGRLGEDEVARRARAGASMTSGHLVGCAVVGGVGALAAGLLGTPMAVAYAAVALGIVLVRARSVADRAPRIALVAVPLLAAAVALVVAAGRVETVSALVLALGCAVATVVVAVVALLPQRTNGMPVAGRSLDLLELFALAALLPLVLGALDLYSYVRHL